MNLPSTIPDTVYVVGAPVFFIEQNRSNVSVGIAQISSSSSLVFRVSRSTSVSDPTFKTYESRETIRLPGVNFASPSLVEIEIYEMCA